jgi:hypothetical protein
MIARPCDKPCSPTSIANLEALDGCLEHARGQGADAHAFLGDFVGYGADAAAVVDRVRDYASRGAIAIKGNHDDALERPAGYFNDQARAALEWARETLDAGQRSFLAALPLLVRVPPVCYVHASADRPSAGITSTARRRRRSASPRRTRRSRSAATFTTSGCISRRRRAG